MLKGFKEFLARGNIVDLSVAVVIGTAFTGLVTKFTDSIIEPLISRIGAGGESDYGILRIGIGGGQTIDLNVLLSAAINFILVAAVVYFLVVVPYNRLRKKGEVEQARSLLGVVVEQLVKVAHPVEHQDVGMLALDAQVLLHHGSGTRQVWRRPRTGA